MNKMRCRIKPTNDVVFKRLFGKSGNEKLLMDFLEAVLGREIGGVNLGKDTQIIPEKLSDKLGVLDVRADLFDGSIVDIEMQNVNYGNIEKRMEYYMSRLYVEELSKGIDYWKLRKVVTVCILNYDNFKDVENYHTIWNMREKNNLGMVLLEKEQHFIELPKFRKGKFDLNDKLTQWLLFIDNERKDLIEMIKEKNMVIKKAAEELEYLTGDEELQRIAFLKRKYELDYNSGMNHAKRTGHAEGLKEGKKEIALKLLKLKMDVKQIAEITGLSKEIIESLR